MLLFGLLCAATALAQPMPPTQPVEFTTDLGSAAAEGGKVVLKIRGVIDTAAGTVRISRAWKKKEGGGYEVGPPKTKKSVRTINLPADVIAQLDMSNEYVFTNSGRGRHNQDGVVRNASFAPNVWHPAVARAQSDGALTKRPRIHDLRHTCASWLIQAGRPLPAVQAQLGHNSIVTTVSVYGHLDRSSGKGNADALASLLKP